MISKNKIKFLRSLSLKKNRDHHNQVILEGFRLVEEAIKAKASIESIYCTSSMMDKALKNKFFNSYNLISITEEECKIISDTKNSQGTIALANTKKYMNNSISNIQKNENIIILDQISDPGNLGTIFRNCIWFGVKSIILTENSIDPFNLKCLRSGVGAHFYFNNIIQDNHDNIVKFLKQYNYDIIIADLMGTKITDINCKTHWALVLGSEAHGTSDTFKEFKKVTINKIGNMESLNVSVASGILLDRLINKGKI